MHSIENGRPRAIEAWSSSHSSSRKPWLSNVTVLSPPRSRRCTLPITLTCSIASSRIALAAVSVTELDFMPMNAATVAKLFATPCASSRSSIDLLSSSRLCSSALSLARVSASPRRAKATTEQAASTAYSSILMRSAACWSASVPTGSKNKNERRRAQAYANETCACSKGQCRGNHDQEEQQERLTRHLAFQRKLKQAGCGKRDPSRRKADRQRPALRCTQHVNAPRQAFLFYG